MSTCGEGKTYKLFIGGRLVESESGKYLTAKSASGEAMNLYSHANANDLGDAVAAARDASTGWAHVDVAERCQYLSRIAGIMKGRVEDFANVVSRSHGVTMEQARNGVAKVLSRIGHYAERKTVETNPLGVAVVLAPDIPVMLPMVSLLLPVIVGGNTAVVLPSERAPLPALTFAEVLDASDLPLGVVNILAGKRDELVPHLIDHEGVDAVVDGSFQHIGILSLEFHVDKLSRPLL